MSAIEKLQHLPTKDAIPIGLEALKQAYRQSLYFTSKYLLGYDQITRGTHGPIITALEENTPRKLICVPRGCFKSTIGVVAYCIWRIIRDPNIRILIDSELYTNSRNFLREIKAHLESPRVVRLFGRSENPRNWNEGEITVLQRTRPYKEATITCGGLGTTKVGQHYNLIIGDDYNSRANSLKRENAQKVIEHYQMNQSILEPDGEYAIIGTRYSSMDLIQFLLDNEINPQHPKEETKGLLTF